MQAHYCDRDDLRAECVAWSVRKRKLKREPGQSHSANYFYAACKPNGNGRSDCNFFSDGERYSSAELPVAEKRHKRGKQLGKLHHSGHDGRR